MANALQTVPLTNKTNSNAGSSGLDWLDQRAERFNKAMLDKKAKEAISKDIKSHTGSRFDKPKVNHNTTTLTQSSFTPR